MIKTLLADRRSFMSAAGAFIAGFRPANVSANSGAPSPKESCGAKQSERIWLSFYENTRVWGYVDKHSVDPGGAFNLMLSVGPDGQPVKGRVEIYRIGFHPVGERPSRAASGEPADKILHEGDRKLVWSSSAVEVGREEVQMTAGCLGAGWPPSLDNVETAGWRSGYYSIDFIDDRDGHRDLDVAFIIVRGGDEPADILVELSTNTYQAYNAWGGYSLYTSIFLGERAQMVAFDRPTPPSFLEYEYFFVYWLERLASENGLRVHYTSNFDIYANPSVLQHYKLLVSGCHNEYWSGDEFGSVYHRIFEAGQNTLFLGANTAYWQIRYADLNGAGAPQGRQMVCFKSSNDPVRYRTSGDAAKLLMTTQFREGARRPETMLAGVAYQSWFEPSSGAKYDYRLVKTDLPFFRDAGYRVGDTITGIVGYEWDNVDPDGDGRRLWNRRSSLIPELDAERVQVLLEGYPVDQEGKRGKAQAVFFESAAGAKVFSTGSIRWAWGLGKQGFEQDRFKRLNANLIMHLLDRL